MIGNHLEPFKFWCQKVLPNVYDDSLSYYEYLCKLNEYLNEVIEQINTLTDNMEDYEEDLTAQWNDYKDALNSEWAETKNYIDNYFNNLDVQQEINNKLDQMASSGELSTLLAPIVGTLIGGVVAQQIGGTVANQIDAVVGSQINGVVADQLGDAAAPIVSNWLLQNVDPVGSAVTIDKTLTIANSAGDAKATGDAINTLRNEISETTRNLYSNYDVEIGIAQNGGSNPDRATCFITIEPSTKYLITLNDISAFDAVYWYTKTAKNTTAYINGGAVSNFLMITSEATAYCLAIQFNKTNVSFDDIKSLKMQIETSTLPTPYINKYCATDVKLREEYNIISDNKEVTRNLFDTVIIGKASNTAISPDRAVAYVPVEVGHKYTISYNDISNFDAVYWYQKATIDTIASVSEGIVYDNETLTINSGVTYLCIQFNKTSISNNDFSSLKMQIEEGIHKTDYIPHISLIDNEIREIRQNTNYIISKEISTFDKILCCGDSLTAGTFNHNEGGSTEFAVFPKYSYPTYLHKLTNCDVSNLGIGGKTSDEWYALEEDADLSGYDCAILQFGVNDAIRYGDWTTPSINGFTNIINKLLAENNNIFIFVATIIPSISYTGSAFNKVSNGIRTLVASINNPHVILIDLANYGHTGNTSAYNCGHLSALGYQRLAEDYANIISEYMNTHKDLFRQIQFIGTNYYYNG